MATNVTGTNILSQWIIEDSKARKTLAAGITLVTGFVKKIGSGIGSLSTSLDAFGGKMVEQAERFTFLAGAILAPITLGFQDFASKNAEVREKINALAEEIKNVPPLNFAKKEAIEQEIMRLLSIEKQTRAAAQANEKLTFAFNAIRFEITKTIAEAILPYTHTIINYVKTAIAWIQTNRELLTQFVQIAGKAGLIFAALAPVLAIGGKLIRVFALLISPAGLVAGALFLIYKGFNYLIGTEVITKTISALVELWKQFQAGLVSAKELGAALIDILYSAFKEAAANVLKRVDEFLGNDFTKQILDKGIIRALRENERIKEMANALYDFFKGAFEQAFTRLKEDVFKGIFGENFLIGLQAYAPYVKQFADSIVNSGLGNIIQQGIGGGFLNTNRVINAAVNAYTNGSITSGASAGAGQVVINIAPGVSDSFVKDVENAIAREQRRAARDLNR